MQPYSYIFPLSEDGGDLLSQHPLSVSQDGGRNPLLPTATPSGGWDRPGGGGVHRHLLLKCGAITKARVVHPTILTWGENPIISLDTHTQTALKFRAFPPDKVSSLTSVLLR